MSASENQYLNCNQTAATDMISQEIERNGVAQGDSSTLGPATLYL